MSTAADNVQKLQQDLLHELVTSNQLLKSISEELQKIKSFTSAGGDFEETIRKNTSLMTTLANMQKLDIENLPLVPRMQFDLSQQRNQNNMDESQ